jgi:hypothetical protein
MDGVKRKAIEPSMTEESAEGVVGVDTVEEVSLTVPLMRISGMRMGREEGGAAWTLPPSLQNKKKHQN